MPHELLKRLCSALLPEKIEGQVDIDKLTVLRKAGLIEVDIPQSQPERGRHCYPGNAIVMRVTPKGRAAATQETPGLPCSTSPAAKRPSVPSPFL
ncbi:hypothetical protein VLK31_29880 [Variovorax sp. H27-G14]|uniref:hypothetical protein n=1 Tax=Variovorax sp. H27-G14 TaxID=3111914 RepID=UPI0038FCFDC0